MAQTIESFVEKLHAEGVQAGHQDAEKLRSRAQADAERIVAEAKAAAEAIVAEAKAEAERIAARQRGELDLAMRDTVLRFRDAIAKAIKALLACEVDEALSDTEFLPRLIHDTVTHYAQQDASGDRQVHINVSPDELERITDWALKYLGDEDRDKARAHVDLQGTLKTHGFEYSVCESTVEVTVEAIVDVLAEQMAPALRKVLDRALADARS